MSSLVYAAMNSLLLGSYLSRIGRIETPSYSACGPSSQDTSHLILHCPATDSVPLALWRLSVSVLPLVQALGSCPASGAPWYSAMPPSLGRGRVTNNNDIHAFSVLRLERQSIILPKYNRKVTNRLKPKTCIQYKSLLFSQLEIAKAVIPIRETGAVVESAT